MKNDNLIILNPSLQDILHDNIYKLEIEEKTFYVPLWCNEVEFAVSDDQDVIVKCNCELPSNITIDNNNNIVYNYSAKIDDIFNKTSILIDMVKHKLCIPVRELNIRKQQYYLFKGVGMRRVNADDIYDCMLSLNDLGMLITVSRLAIKLSCSARTIYRHMPTELKKEKELLNQQL